MIRPWLVVMALLLHTACFAADRYWVAKESGAWSNPAHWSGVSGGNGGASVPGAGDRAIFDGKGQACGDATIDGDAPGTVREIVIHAGYTGTITQARHLTVTSDLLLDGGSATGWTFPPATLDREVHQQRVDDLSLLDPEAGDVKDLLTQRDTPANLTVQGALTVGKSATITCTRSSALNDGEGRTITVGKDLIIHGRITADGQGLQIGPGTAKQQYIDNRHPISIGGSGYGGRGGAMGKYTSGGTYGSITAPVSLGSGAPRAERSKIDAGRFTQDEQEKWSEEDTIGGGAITLRVAGETKLFGVISANGKAGDVGASGGSVYLTTGSLSGNGRIAANGSYGPPYGYGRGPGGGGRIAAILTEGDSFAEVTFECYGGDGRFSSPAAAGTIYLQAAGQSEGKGTLIVDNKGQSSAMRSAVRGERTTKDEIRCL